MTAPKHDEHALLREAETSAREQLASRGRIVPSAFMLVQRNPQTGAPLTYPTAVGTSAEDVPLTPEGLEAFINDIATESARLDARAVALLLEARADVEESTGKAEPGTLRVAVIRMEDSEGVWIFHATIESFAQGPTLGRFMTTGDGNDPVPGSLLKRTGVSIP